MYINLVCKIIIGSLKQSVSLIMAQTFYTMFTSMISLVINTLILSFTSYLCNNYNIILVPWYNYNLHIIVMVFYQLSNIVIHILSDTDYRSYYTFSQNVTSKILVWSISGLHFMKKYHQGQSKLLANLLPITITEIEKCGQ